ncbi:hypothetical protein PQC06_gp066 [Aeromonas phage LAh10]|uniref:Uncharacterized protein n=1 Tax=Aeromonas phage LAh10 TaxID=2591025 RepID=A0A514A1K9_9CAUD|nr:hypothetical protein PQC06_gp066 [Aeromonas phage LAh10]QDH47112.1 hypothetical protein LAh10_66 [Aeromonas phage LAh10]
MYVLAVFIKEVTMTNKNTSRKNKKYNPNKARGQGVITKLFESSSHVYKVKNITKYLNQALGAFYVVGDLYHDPMTFGMDVLTKNLSGDMLKTAQGQMLEFLFKEHRTWHIEVFHFFDFDGIVECVPVKGAFPEMTLGVIADLTTAFIEESRTVLFELPEYEGMEGHYKHFGYYLNYGDDIDFDHMDPLITEAFFKVSRDLTVNKAPASISGKHLIDCMTKTPDQIAGSEGVELTTDMIDIETLKGVK